MNFLKDQVPISNSTSSICSIPYDGYSGDYVFSDVEFDEILKRKKKSSVGGEDKIKNENVKALSRRSLLMAVNDMFLETNIKDSLRIIQIIPIPKKYKDLIDYKNFRPI